MLIIVASYWINTDLITGDKKPFQIYKSVFNCKVNIKIIILGLLQISYTNASNFT